VLGGREGREGIREIAAQVGASTTADDGLADGLAAPGPRVEGSSGRGAVGRGGGGGGGDGKREDVSSSRRLRAASGQSKCSQHTSPSGPLIRRHVNQS
jgi:hypothetical protein